MPRNSERRRISPDELAGHAGRWLPAPALKALLSRALQGLGVSLCLHRIAARPRPTDWQQGLSMPAPELDALIDLLREAKPARLSITFDDGYREAAAYLASRAPRFPDVDFTFFVCPEKAETGAGFRWDLVEESIKSGAEVREALLGAPVDVRAENSRSELIALSRLRDYELCGVDELRTLTKFPNVQLGNHTSLHVSAANSPDEVVKADFERSTAVFTRLFQAPAQFAFPYGTPRHHFGQRHVEWLRALGEFSIWTTEARPYRLEEVRPGGVLPRFPIDGRKNASELAGWIAARSLDFRVRGTKHRFES
jgi:peptidoglycan/xylan/chitin deacetylase (PgdA/CDA1 family)